MLLLVFVPTLLVAAFTGFGNSGVIIALVLTAFAMVTQSAKG